MVNDPGAGSDALAAARAAFDFPAAQLAGFAWPYMMSHPSSSLSRLRAAGCRLGLDPYPNPAALHLSLSRSA